MKTFFADTQRRYRYWYNSRPGRDVEIKIQMRREVLRNFRTGAGRRLESIVDILECGGGWYSITTRDNLEWDRVFGTHTDGAKAWMAAFNQAHLANINANQFAFAVQRVARIDYQPLIEARAARMQQRLKSHFSRRQS